MCQSKLLVTSVSGNLSMMGPFQYIIISILCIRHGAKIYIFVHIAKINELAMFYF